MNSIETIQIVALILALAWLIMGWRVFRKDDGLLAVVYLAISNVWAAAVVILGAVANGA